MIAVLLRGRRRDRRFDEAMGWLLPIANSPHESPRRAVAREQMEKLKAAKAAQVGTAGGAR